MFCNKFIIPNGGKIISFYILKNALNLTHFKDTTPHIIPSFMMVERVYKDMEQNSMTNIIFHNK